MRISMLALALCAFFVGCGSTEDAPVWFDCECTTSCGDQSDTVVIEQFDGGDNTVEQAQSYTQEASDEATTNLQSVVDSGAAPDCATPEGYVVLCQCRSTDESC